MAVGTCAWLATVADIHMIERIMKISPWDTDPRTLPFRPGYEVASELGGRMLLRYVVPYLQHEAQQGKSIGKEIFATPTPYSASDALKMCKLPAGYKRRTYVVLLDPANIDFIQGPKYAKPHGAIEYILPNGYDVSSIISKQAPWADVID